jgi:hypothetical protein
MMCPSTNRVTDRHGEIDRHYTVELEGGKKETAATDSDESTYPPQVQNNLDELGDIVPQD